MKTQKVIVEKLRVARSFKDRTVGLMFSKDLPTNEGLLIPNCRSVHTFFMNYEMDAIFLDEQNKIIKIIRKMKPARMTRIYFTASKVIELKGGVFPQDILEGDQLEVNDA